MAMPSLSWDTTRLIQHRCFCYLMYFMPHFLASNVLYVLSCESHQLGKYLYASYPQLDYVPRKTISDILHCIVWGPLWVPSILRFCYYIIFVDDFSLASWGYLIKNCTNILPFVHQFLQEIFAQNLKSTKVLSK